MDNGSNAIDEKRERQRTRCPLPSDALILSIGHQARLEKFWRLIERPSLPYDAVRPLSRLADSLVSGLGSAVGTVLYGMKGRERVVEI
jgi:hypothetical protein